MTLVWQGFTESAEFFNGEIFPETERDNYMYQSISNREAEELIELGDFVVKQDDHYWIPILEV
jgi:hypothetical protein